MCPTHDVLRGADVRKVRQANPGAVIIAHPECREEVLSMADGICSTAAMVSKPAKYPGVKTFLIATESGIQHQMKKAWPDRGFIMADGCMGSRLYCPYLKLTTLEDVRRALVEEVHEIQVSPRVAEGARRALERMLAIQRD